MSEVSEVSEVSEDTAASIAPSDAATTNTPVSSYDQRGVMRRLLRRPVGVIALLYLITVALGALFAPSIAPYNPLKADFLAPNAGPSGKHLLGTDSLGRDLFSRLLHGGRASLGGVTIAIIVLMLVGIPAGLAAGYFGGVVDRGVAWIADVALSIPTIVFLLLVASIYRGNLKAAMITLGCLFAPGMMRVTRAATLGVRNELYITAARVSGLSHAAIITRHVLKRILGPIIVQLSIAGGVALGVQSGLAFIGLGVKPPSPSWGFDLADATTLISENRWPLVPPAAVIGLSIMCFGLLGDAIRDSAAERWSTPTRKVPRGGRRHLIAAPFADGLPPGPQALLSVRGLTIAFDSPGGDILAVEGVSFDAHAGETLGIVGESGCGKTISVLGVMGVLPGSGRIVRGSVRLAGRELVGLDNESLRRLRGSEIAYISQEPMVALNPAFRVGQLLSAAIRIHHGVSRTEAGRRALSLLADVRLPEPEIVAKRYPHELSGGMAQRVAIALALSGEPKVLIADEPTTALDVTVQAEILDLLRNLQAQRGMAIVLVTHDWGVVCDLAATAVVMYAGEVAEQASIRELVRDPKHPYTAGLLESDPHRVTTDILPTIPGVVPPPGHWPIGCHFAARCTYATPECSAAPIPLVHLVGGREVRCLHFDEVGLGKNAAHV